MRIEYHVILVQREGPAVKRTPLVRDRKVGCPRLKNLLLLDTNSTTRQLGTFILNTGIKLKHETNRPLQNVRRFCHTTTHHTPTPTTPPQHPSPHCTSTPHPQPKTHKTHKQTKLLPSACHIVTRTRRTAPVPGFRVWECLRGE